MLFFLSWKIRVLILEYFIWLSVQIHINISSITECWATLGPKRFGQETDTVYVMSSPEFCSWKGHHRTIFLLQRLGCCPNPGGSVGIPFFSKICLGRKRLYESVRKMLELKYLDGKNVKNHVFKNQQNKQNHHSKISKIWRISKICKINLK